MLTKQRNNPLKLLRNDKIKTNLLIIYVPIDKWIKISKLGIQKYFVCHLLFIYPQKNCSGLTGGLRASLWVWSGLGVTALLWLARPRPVGFSGLGVMERRLGGPAVELWGLLTRITVLGAALVSSGEPSGTAKSSSSGWYRPLRHFSTTWGRSRGFVTGNLCLQSQSTSA